MHRYEIQYAQIDPNARIPGRDTVRADTFKRDGDVIIFYRADEPVYSINIGRLLNIERQD